MHFRCVCVCVCIHAEGHRCKPAICSSVSITVNNICSEKMCMFPFGSLNWAWKVPVLSSPVKLSRTKSSHIRSCQTKQSYFIYSETRRPKSNKYIYISNQIKLNLWWMLVCHIPQAFLTEEVWLINTQLCSMPKSYKHKQNRPLKYTSIQ